MASRSSTNSQPSTMSPSAVANPSYHPVPHPAAPFKSFQSFYPFYLGEHSQRINRLLHLTGTSIAVAIYSRLLLGLVGKALLALPTADRAAVLKLARQLALDRRQLANWLLLGLAQGYAFAWVGHFFVEKNRPATFKYPLFSLRGDFRMLWEVATLQRSV